MHACSNITFMDNQLDIGIELEGVMPLLQGCCLRPYLSDSSFLLQSPSSLRTCPVSVSQQHSVSISPNSSQHMMYHPIHQVLIFELIPQLLQGVLLKHLMKRVGPGMDLSSCSGSVIEYIWRTMEYCHATKTGSQTFIH